MFVNVNTCLLIVIVYIFLTGVKTQVIVKIYGLNEEDEHNLKLVENFSTFVLL